VHAYRHVGRIINSSQFVSRQRVHTDDRKVGDMHDCPGGTTVSHVAADLESDSLVPNLKLEASKRTTHVHNLPTFVPM